VNLGQLVQVLRARAQRPIRSYARATGTPFKVAELREAIVGALHNSPSTAHAEAV
jgi:hypothetical protein